MKTVSEIVKSSTTDSPLSVKLSQRLVLAGHPKYRDLTDEQLVTEVKKNVRGIVSRRTGQMILPIVTTVNDMQIVNRPMAIAVLMGTMNLL